MISFVHLKGLVGVDPLGLLHTTPLWIRHQLHIKGLVVCPSFVNLSLGPVHLIAGVAELKAIFLNGS